MQTTYKNSAIQIFFKWLIILCIGLALLGIYNSRETTEERVTKERYNKANQSQKECFQGLGEGSLNNQSLSWKLDRCKIPK